MKVKHVSNERGNVSGMTDIALTLLSIVNTYSVAIDC